jgi:hypothetical protein
MSPRNPGWCAQTNEKRSRQLPYERGTRVRSSKGQAPTLAGRIAIGRTTGVRLADHEGRVPALS